MTVVRATAKGRGDRLFDVTGRPRRASSTRVHKGILQIVLCIGLALARPLLARAQDAVPSVLLEPTPLPELSKRTEATPMATPGAEKPSIEISAGTPSEKPAPIVKHTPHLKTLATPIATVEKKTPVRPTITQPEAPELKAPEPTPATPITLSALKAVAIKAPLPDYPYQAKNAHITGSGVCVLLVDTASGRVTSATMAQSTGNEILDKATTNTFGRWRFKPGTLSQVQVPITYE
jgi:TonB family protein